MGVDPRADDQLRSTFLALVAALMQLQSHEGDDSSLDGFLARLASPRLDEVLSSDDRAVCAVAFSRVVRSGARDAAPAAIPDARIAALVPGITRRLVDATSLAYLTRLASPHPYTSQATVSDALAALRGRPDGFIAFLPRKGEAGLIAPEDLGIWFERAILAHDGFPQPAATSLAQAFDLSVRRWRTVPASLTVGQVRALFSNAAHRFDAVLVVDERGDGGPLGIVIPGDLAMWQHPTRGAAERAQALLDAQQSRLNQAARTKRDVAEVQDDGEGRVPGAVPTVLLDTPVLAYEPLYAGLGGHGRIAGVLREMLAPLGLVGATPYALLSALRGVETPEVIASRLDVHPAFGCGQQLPASVVGDLLQRLLERGYVVAAGPLRVQVAPVWTSESDLTWLDAPATGEQAIERPETQAPEKRPAPAVERVPAVSTPTPAPVPTPTQDAVVSQPSHEPLEALRPRPYVAYRGQRQRGDFFKAANILSMALQVIRFEGPIAGTLLIRRVVGLWGITNVTTPVRDRMSDVLRQTLTRGGVVTSTLGGEMFYMTSEQRLRPVVRTNTGSMSGRGSGEIPVEEVRIVVQHLLWEGPRPRASVVEGICTTYGLDASKAAPQRSMGLAVDTLVERGVLLADGKMLALKG